MTQGMGQVARRGDPMITDGYGTQYKIGGRLRHTRNGEIASIRQITMYGMPDYDDTVVMFKLVYDRLTLTPVIYHLDEMADYWTHTLAVP